MKKVIAVIFIILVIFGTVSVYAANTNSNTLTAETATSNLVELKDKAWKTMQDYQAAYGNDTYGMVICQVLPLIFAIVVRGWRG